jgi:hypothetical protein
VAVTQVQDH